MDGVYYAGKLPIFGVMDYNSPYVVQMKIVEIIILIVI